MGGTSADGLDIAIVRITPRRNTPHLELLLHKAFPFPKALRVVILAAQDAQRTSTAELAQLNWRMGLAYAEAFTSIASVFEKQIDIIGCHGQTVYHQSTPRAYAGRRFACTWQIGEMAPLASAAGIPVYANFRPADMVAGGQGAPLVPLLDQALYRDTRRTRILQNIGGTGNLTVVPPAGSNAPVIAFDTGPGNMVIDTLTQQLFSKNFDRNGRIASCSRSLTSFCVNRFSPAPRRAPAAASSSASTLPPRCCAPAASSAASRKMPWPPPRPSPRKASQRRSALSSLPWLQTRSSISSSPAAALTIKLSWHTFNRSQTPAFSQALIHRFPRPCRSKRKRPRPSRCLPI
jgi:hypothetical protein